MTYPTVVADFPWPYELRGSALGNNRAVDNKYKIMEWPDIQNTLNLLHKVLPDHAAVCMWVVPPTTDRAIEATKAAGFRYVTKLASWVKLTSGSYSIFTGLGFYSRANSEDLLLFVNQKKRQGSPIRLRKDVKQVVITLHEEQLRENGGTPTLLWPIGRHSQKPEQIQDAIERLFQGPYLELFARRQRPGWTCLGNEIDGLDIRDALQRLKADEVPV